MMKSFEAAGQAILATQEGNIQIAREVSAMLGRWISGLLARNGRALDEVTSAGPSRR